MSLLVSLFFMDGWYIIPFDITSFLPQSFVIYLALKVVFNLLLFILVCAAYPRFRYDQSMSVGWKVLLPLVIFLLYF